MTIEKIKIALRCLLFILLQIILFNKLALIGYINPFFYVLAVIMLPFEIGAIAGLLIGFFIGLSIDFFMNTMGIHAGACSLLMFVRPTLLKMFGSRDGYEPDAQPSIKTLGLVPFIYLAGIMVVIHHSYLFFIEIFSFSNFFGTLFKIIISSGFTLILILLVQFLMFSKKAR